MADDVISLADLLLQCEQAEQRMSARNPHRLLLQQCRVALLELAERLRPVSNVMMEAE